MYIKVINCSDDTYWYKEYIGKVFIPKFIDEPTEAYVIDNIDGTGNTMGSIFPGDFEEVIDFSEDDLFIFPDPPKSQTEILQETLDTIILNSL